jgi:myo-inositol 2-dehydrogenase/D-chiro-inositol 1-dehydrogenase
MRVALIGGGRVGTMHARSVVAHPDVTDLVVYDVDAARARDLASAVGAQPAASDEAALDGADAAVIATSTSAHVAYIRACARRRIPAFCEKPISLDLDETRAVLEVVAQAGTALQVGFQRRFDPEFRAARERIEDGSLGRVYCVRLAAHDRTPPRPGDGGILRDLHLHDFDLVRFLFASEVEEVYATASALGCPGFEGYEGIDTAAAVMRLRDGVVGALTGTRYNLLGYDVRAEIFGSDNSMAVGSSDRAPLRSAAAWDAPQGPPFQDFEDRFGAAYRAELLHFIDVALGRAANLCTGRDGYEAMRLAVAADLSRAEDRPVRLEEIPAL